MVNERLQHIIDDLPIMKQMFDHDVFLTVLDTEQIVQGFSVPDSETPKLKVGDVFEDPSGAYKEVLRTGRSMPNRLPKEVMGEVFEGMLIPVKDDSRVVGCIICAYSADAKEQLLQIAGKFQESANRIDSSVQAVVGGIEHLSKTLTHMNEITNNVESDVKTAVDVVGKISSNASRSNILALNASIEAARSGENGRGFAVVATEMGKLANDSGSSATAIKSTLSTITEHLASIITSIKDANDMAKEHMDNINTIQNILKQTTELAGKLEENVNL